MTLKSLVVTRPRRKYYADVSEAIPRYRWLVEDALSDPTKMFNVTSAYGVHDGYYLCKVCGDARTRSEWVDHVDEHAFQLGIIDAFTAEELVPYERFMAAPVAVDVTGVDAVDERFEEIFSIVMDAIVSRTEEGDMMPHIADVETLTREVTSTIVSYVNESSAVQASVCVDCTV